MEIILVSLTLLTLILLVILVGTGGKPLTLVSHFQSFVAQLRANKIQLFVLIQVLRLPAEQPSPTVMSVYQIHQRFILEWEI